MAGKQFTHFSPYRLRGAFGDQCFIEISLSADEGPLHGYPQTEYDRPAHAIASFLDNQCGQIDSIIEEAKSSVEEYKKWRSILIFEAITKGIDPNVEKKIAA